MLPVEIVPVDGSTLVLRARGSELLILPHHIDHLKGCKTPKEFTGYFLSTALLNRPARKLFEAWLRKDKSLWQRVYRTIHNDMDGSTEEEQPAKVVKEEKVAKAKPAPEKAAADKKEKAEKPAAAKKEAVKEAPAKKAAVEKKTAEESPAKKAPAKKKAATAPAPKKKKAAAKKVAKPAPKKKTASKPAKKAPAKKKKG